MAGVEVWAGIEGRYEVPAGVGAWRLLKRLPMRSLSMRILSYKALCSLILAAILASPLLVGADESCRCPDCARQTCIATSEACSVPLYSGRGVGCCEGEESTLSPRSESHARVDVRFGEAGHQPHTDSQGCRCSAYLCYDGNALPPLVSVNQSSLPCQFCPPRTEGFLTSGWRHQTFHPPR